jgi:hypothetical protein
VLGFAERVLGLLLPELDFDAENPPFELDFEPPPFDEPPLLDDSASAVDGNASSERVSAIARSDRGATPPLSHRRRRGA